MVDKITDIEEILAKAKAEEPNRGKLKIFFGAMAGVGKTFAMLEAARVRKKEGADVVAGYVETHKRAETDALLEGLEILPRKNITYKGVNLSEFDVDGALKRHPSLILVDELAHTNAPGCRNLKRWQDVKELLEAGIDVYTTLNVQHCESINDVIAQITGVTVRETVSDTFVEKAEDIELVDLPPEDLLQRLKEGKVYLGDQAERAIENFFQLGNLIALRQLALQYTSRLVSAKMRTYKQAYSVSKVWNVRDRFLVSISPSPRAMNLIRAGKRIASEMGVEWTVAYVEMPSYAYSKKDAARVAEMMRFAEKLGAETVILPGQNTAESLISYARSKNITKIIAGKPGKPRWHELLFGSTVNELARKCQEIDLFLMSGDSHEHPIKFNLQSPKSFSWIGLIAALALVAFFTVAGKLISPYLESSNMGMIYLLGIVLVAYRYGLRISLITAVLSVLAYDYFFVMPLYTFQMSDIKRDLIDFSIILIISLMISLITSRLRQQTISMRQRENRTESLYHLTRDLAKSSSPYELLQIGSFNMQKFFNCLTAIFYADKDGKLKLYLDNSNGMAKTDNEQVVAQWAYAHGSLAGKDTDTLSGSKGTYVPLIGSEKTVGVMGMYPKEEKQFADSEQLHMLEMFASQTAVAVEGAQLAETTVKAESDIENERLRNMILSTFSLDLSAPLKAISEAASNLSKTENMDDKLRREVLINKILSEVERLNNLSKEIADIIKSKDELG